MLEAFVSLAQQVGTPACVLLGLLARLTVVTAAKHSEARSRFRFAFSILVLHFLFLLPAWALGLSGSALASGARVGAGLSGSLAAVTLGSLVFFDGIVRRLRPGLPRIVPDLLTTGVAVVALMQTSSQLGFEVSGVIATSAVLTAVIGLALQDTLGNALGGLALQLDSSIQVGDWISFNSVFGRVSEIHWRYTAIETNNWETVIVPNSMLMRAQVAVHGRRRGGALQARRRVEFQVDFRHSPGDVIEAIERALAAQPIPNVAAEPPPNCIASAFAESQTRYMVRYWLTDLGMDESTDSLVRNRIFYALARARMSLSIPAQTVFVTEEGQERHAQKRAAEHEQRLAALRRIDLFASLSNPDLSELAQRLNRAPFAKGETITREGAAAHHLYMIMAGQVSVRVGGPEQPREVGQLGPGAFFGEMALLTGERRSASAVAVSDVDCYRLDADAFRALLARHPDLAERVAQVLAEREVGLHAAKDRVGADDKQLKSQRERALLSKIRAFFELD
jgi:small-conductance mechanosensitive channel/CRP-like cAMP-binding protein